MLRQLQLVALNYLRRVSVWMLLAGVGLVAVFLYATTGVYVRYAVHFPEPGSDLISNVLGGSDVRITARDGLLLDQLAALLQAAA